MQEQPSGGACSRCSPDIFRRDAETLDWLAGHRFSGAIEGYAEGELYFPGSPVLTVVGSFAEAVLLETLALSVLIHDSAIASAAARMVCAAADRACIEMGSRRTHEETAVDAARAAYLAGFCDVQSGHGGSVRRTHDRYERARLHPPSRRREHGVRRTGHATSRAGRKYAVRRHGPGGLMTAEIVGTSGPPPAQAGDRGLQVPLLAEGRRTGTGGSAQLRLEAAREHHRRVMTSLPPAGQQLSRGEPAIDTEFVQMPV